MQGHAPQRDGSCTVHAVASGGRELGKVVICCVGYPRRFPPSALDTHLRNRQQT